MIYYSISQYTMPQPPSLSKQLPTTTTATRAGLPNVKMLECQPQLKPFVEVVWSIDPEMQSIVHLTQVAILKNIAPIRIEECSSGAYYLRHSNHRIFAIFKPQDEEPYAENNPKGYTLQEQPTSFSSRLLSNQKQVEVQPISSHPPIMRKGINAGQACIRECMVYFIDQYHQAKYHTITSIGKQTSQMYYHANVPMTAFVSSYHSVYYHSNPTNSNTATRTTTATIQDCSKSSYNSNNSSSRHENAAIVKYGSFQKYVSHDCTADDIGPSFYTVNQVHRLVILDILIANQDRHGGNLLIRKHSCTSFQHVDIIPIDHGCSVPNIFGLDQTTFCWLDWPQAQTAFDTNMRAFIKEMDIYDLIDTMMASLDRTLLNAMEKECLLTLILCARLLQIAVLKYDKTGYDIGIYMTRSGPLMDEMSEFEKIIQNIVSVISLKELSMALEKDWKQYRCVFETFVYMFENELNEYFTATQQVG